MELLAGLQIQTIRQLILAAFFGGVVSLEREYKREVEKPQK